VFVADTKGHIDTIELPITEAFASEALLENLLLINQSIMIPYSQVEKFTLANNFKSLRNGILLDTERMGHTT
jgi:hypothetical protein